MWKCHTTSKQQPLPDEDSQIFWEGCRRQRLLIQQCDTCQTFRFPPSPLCPACLSGVSTWRADPGAGEVLTFCVYHTEIAGPAWQPCLPYVVAVVRLWWSGVNMLSQLLCEDPQRVYIGLPVYIAFDVRPNGLILPRFLPLDAADAGELRPPNSELSQERGA